MAVFVFVMIKYAKKQEDTNESQNNSTSDEDFSPFPSLKAKINACKLLYISLDIARQYEKEEHNDSFSCQEDLKEQLMKRIVAAKDEFEEFEEGKTDYVKIAHTLLVNEIYNMLASDTYTIRHADFLGVLDPLSCGPNLLTVYKKSLEWGVKNGYITNDEKDDEFRTLYKIILGMRSTF